MADKYVNELPQETYNTLDGTEQFVMFDVAEGKRSTLNTIGNYVLSKMTPDNLDKSVTGTISDMQTDIDTLQLAVGSPLVAETVSNMTDTTKIYVYVGNETGYTAGNWYYWNGTGWVSGGVYNAEAVATDTTLAISGAPADSKATGDALDTKVDKVTGKGLSTEDYTTEEKTKLSGIATGATNVVIDDTLTTTGQAADAKKTGDEISDLKEDLTQLQTDMENGNFPETAVGSADQLISDNYVVENEPYQFRKSGGSALVGTRMEDVIVGGSIIWNQLANKSRLASRGGTGTWSDDVYVLTADGTYTSTLHYGFDQAAMDEKQDGHVVFASCTCKSIHTDKFRLRVSNSMFWTEDVMANTWTTVFGVANIVSNSYLFTVYANDDTLYSSSDALSFKNVVLFDLTAMFGSTIADYIYSLEQANQGDGVAWFKKLFPKDYYTYNAGELMHVSGLSEHKTVGFNVWDEEWERGVYDNNTGAPNNNNNHIRSKNYIPVIPNTTYCFTWGNNYKSVEKTSCGFFFYTKDKVYLSKSSNTGYGGNSRLITTPENAYYIRFIVGDWLDTKINDKYYNDICINLSDPAKNGTYEPYEKHSYPLDSTLILRGIPKLDSNNKLYFDGDRYLANGVVERRYGIVDLGSLTWSGLKANGYKTAQLPSAKGAFKDSVDIANIICTSATTTFVDNVYNGNDGVGIRWSGEIYFKNQSIDAQTNPTGYLVYELATPTTEQADPYHNPQIVDQEGTEEYVCTSLVPVGHETKYFEDLKGKIEGLPSNFATLIADTEKTFKATKNYSQGDYLIVNNQLYKVSSAITSGSTITPGTNVTATTIMAEILALA